jgi:serine/threonine-protein kinase
VAVDSSGFIYAANFVTTTLQVYAGIASVSPGTRHAAVQLQPGQRLARRFPKGGFSGPFAVALDAADNIYVADSGNGRIVVVLAALTSTQVAPDTELFSFNDTTDPLINLQAVSVDAAGNIWAADVGNLESLCSPASPLPRLEPSSRCTLIRHSRCVRAPLGTAFDSAGRVYVADSHRIAVLLALESAAPDKQLYNIFTSPYLGFDEPYAVALDSSDRIYVVDVQHSRIAVLASVSSTSPPPGSELYS